MARSAGRVSGARLLALLACVAAGLVQLRQVQARHRYSPHESLFGDDEASDTHTVSAGSQQTPASRSPASPVRNLLRAGTSSLTANEQLRQGNSSSNNITVTVFGSTNGSLARFASEPKLTALEPLRKPAATSTAKRQVATPVVFVSQDAPIAQQSAASRGNSSPSNHWSALRNYYDKLRPVAWDDAKSRVVPAVVLADSQQQRLYDIDASQQHNKQIYTVDQAPPLSYPPVNQLKSPFELPTQHHGSYPGVQLASSGQFSQLPECRPSRPVMVPYEPIVQRPIADYALDFPGLPDKIFFNQQQTRYRHQQDTFGSLVDRSIQDQLQQEEMNCGPRNVVRSLVAGRRPYDAGFAEYPSHVGLYNNSQANDNNFICSATLVHSRFALTLASCLRNQTANNLFVRTGDWNVNRKMNEADRQLIMMVRQVTRAHLFPRYQSGNEHNLALVEWQKPIEFSASEYISPACQAPSRSALRMRTCFAPVRNITLSNYFDADGDGETKQRQDVQMVEVPVSLIPFDDNECRRQTQMDSFNFQHPNYICSADFKQKNWRALLKQSQYSGSGIYCDDGGLLNLVSIMQPMQATNATSDYGFLDLSYYRPWMRNVIASQAGYLVGFIKQPQ